MKRNSYLGQILSIDKPGTKVREDAFSVDIDEKGNYIANIYISDPITNNQKIIDNITRLYMSNNGANSILIKDYFRNYGLSERNEKDCFCFSFVLDKNANILSFNTSKKKIQIDIEMDYDIVTSNILDII
ncbi:MAG: hypothetical protein IJA94_02285 [Bacilli bacterium]|nr:hypothetical protein [Bacilli bacterium]